MTKERMRIEDLDAADGRLLEALAVLTHEAAGLHAPSWLPALEDAREEVADATAAGHITRVLSRRDLYADPIGALATMTAERTHPVGFWLRMGYSLVGMIPDAERPGVPTLTLAKSPARATPA